LLLGIAGMTLCVGWTLAVALRMRCTYPLTTEG